MKRETYVSGNYRKRIKTQRFLYHFTRNYSRSEINQKGLIGSSSKVIGYNNAVFAHNDSLPDSSWYPFCFDECWNWGPYYENIDNFEVYCQIMDYDFWRIDTWKIKNTWFIDNVAASNFNTGKDPRNIDLKLYVVTFEDIPRNALKLFKFQEPFTRYLREANSAHVNVFSAFREYKFKL